MYKFLRILFTILSALCVTAAFIVGAYLGFPWIIASVLAAFLFFMLMLLFKQKQEERDAKKQPPDPEKEAEAKPSADVE